MIRNSDSVSALRIVANVGDQVSGGVYEGWNTVHLTTTSVQLQFIGPSDKEIDADLRYETMVRTS